MENLENQVDGRNNVGEGDLLGIGNTSMGNNGGSGQQTLPLVIPPVLPNNSSRTEMTLPPRAKAIQ